MIEKNINLYLLFTVVVCVILIIAYIVFSHKDEVTLSSNETTKDLKSKEKISHTRLNLGLYTDILNMFKCLNQYRASIKEIINLIDNNAEVGYSVLNEKHKNEDYSSNEILYFWLESYYSQYELYLYYTIDIVYAVKDNIAYDVYIKLKDELVRLTDYCDYVEKYIKDDYNKVQV